MRRLKLDSPQDFLAILVRHKSLVIVTGLGLFSAISLLTYILPKTYVSETLTLIRPRDVPNEFVRNLIAGTDEQRLGAIEQSVLSRTNLVQILQEFEDKMPDYRGLNTDQATSKLRNEITINFQLDRRSPTDAPGTYFRISYQNRNPEFAQQIAKKLTSLFIEKDNQTRETQVFGTTDFFASEVEKKAELIRQSDTKLKELKTRRRFELPDQLETNLRTLSQLGELKKANAESLDRFATIRFNLEQQLSETPATITPQIPEAAARPRSTNPLVEQYEKQQLEFDELSAKYSPRHPDVAKAKSALDKLRAKIPPEDLVAAEKAATAPPPKVPNPLYQSLTAQLREVKTEIDIREKERESIGADIEKYRQRVQNAPQSEQDISGIMRENTELNKQYDELKNKLEQAKLSESLESKQKGSQFVVVDPANYPLSPTKPVKWAIILVGALISLAISFGSAIVVDVVNQRIHTQAEIESLFGVSVLIEIPQIVTNSDVVQARRKKWRLAASSMAGALIYSVCLYMVYLKQAPVLRHLDPIIHKLMY